MGLGILANTHGAHKRVKLSPIGTAWIWLRDGNCAFKWLHGAASTSDRAKSFGIWYTDLPSVMVQGGIGGLVLVWLNITGST
jgi:hypothetical protein